MQKEKQIRIGELFLEKIVWNLLAFILANGKQSFIPEALEFPLYDNMSLENLAVLLLACASIFHLLQEN